MPSSKSKTTLRPSHEWQFEAIGTHWWVGIYEQRADILQLQNALAERIEVFDQVYSRFRPDSLVTKLGQEAGEYTFPDDAAPLLEFYRGLYDTTEGAVTPLIGGLLSDAGYGANYSLRPGTLHPVPSWDERMEVSGSIVRTKQPVRLDFGAAGKGYLVDILTGVLRANNVTQFCIDASGDMRITGTAEPLVVGLENPDNSQQVLGTISLGNRALCASAPARRQWQSYHHIMDPKRRISPGHIKAIWVIANTAMLADGLTTALFFTDPNVLRKQYEFEYAILYADGRFTYSQTLPIRIFTERNQ